MKSTVDSLDTIVCIKIHGRIHKSSRDYKTVINDISLSNGQSNRKDQLRSGNVLKTLCQLSTRQLSRMVSSCGVPIQQQKVYGNRKDTIQIKL